MLRKDVDWSKASCKGIDTNIFFMTEGELLDKENILLASLRRLCFECPIWKECATIGFKYERYGIWGGVNGEERLQIRAKKNASKKVMNLREHCETLGFDYKRILEVSKVEKEYTF